MTSHAKGKKASGERAKMYWCANMKGGLQKEKEEVMRLREITLRKELGIKSQADVAKMKNINATIQKALKLVMHKI